MLCFSLLRANGKKMNRKPRHNAPRSAGSGTQEGYPARKAILEAVRRAKPPAVPLPAITGVRDAGAGDPVARFMASVQAAAADVQIVGTGGVEAAVRERFPEAGSIAATVPAWSFDWMTARTDVQTMARLDVLVCPGELGVAENGAVWLSESGMGPRAAPFLTQHLMLVLDRSAIVADMHAAYDRLDVAQAGYGVFVAGPSKTADIEQALVIGAHGPRSLTVLLM